MSIEKELYDMLAEYVSNEGEKEGYPGLFFQNWDPKRHERAKALLERAGACPSAPVINYNRGIEEAVDYCRSASNHFDLDVYIILQGMAAAIEVLKEPLE